MAPPSSHGEYDLIVDGHFDGIDSPGRGCSRPHITAASWAALAIDSYSLADLAVTDFEMIDTGLTIALTYDCVRSYPILRDGFELGSLSRWNAAP